MLLGSRSKGFVSELNGTEETLALSPAGFFLPDMLQFSKLAVHWQQHWYTPLLLGYCAEPGLLGFPHVTSHTNRSRVPVCVRSAVGLGSRSRGCTLVMAYHEKELMWLNLWVWGAEVFTQQPAHPEQACLEEWGTNVWAKGGLDLEAQTDRTAETDRSWKQTHRSTSACLCSAKRHLQSLDHDGCNLLCWNFSIHRLTVQCRRIIYLMCTYLLQCPSNRLPFPSFLHSMNLFMVFSTKAKSLMTSKMQ